MLFNVLQYGSNCVEGGTDNGQEGRKEGRKAGRQGMVTVGERLT
jgi:hypothetical protein